MKNEYFKPIKIDKNTVNSLTINEFFPQTRDWTCGLACIRTCLSVFMKDTVPSEDDLIKAGNLTPGPLASRDFIQFIPKGRIITRPKRTYHETLNPEELLSTLIDLMEDNIIMVRSGLIGGHWTVLCGYYKISDKVDTSQLLYYDPYYDRMNLISVEEFLSIWEQPEKPRDKTCTITTCDFIAIA